MNTCTWKWSITHRTNVTSLRFRLYYVSHFIMIRKHDTVEMCFYTNCMLWNKSIWVGGEHLHCQMNDIRWLLLNDRVSFQRHVPLFHSKLTETERCTTSIVYTRDRKWFIIHIAFTQNALQNHHQKTSLKTKTQLIRYSNIISMFHRIIKDAFQGKAINHVPYI